MLQNANIWNDHHLDIPMVNEVESAWIILMYDSITNRYYY